MVPVAGRVRTSSTRPRRCLGQRVADGEELGLVVVALAIEPCLRVAGVSLLRLSPWKSRSPLPLAAGPNRLWRGSSASAPTRNLRAVDREVLVWLPPPHLLVVQKRGQELVCNRRLQQPAGVLREHRRHPHRLVDAESDNQRQSRCLHLSAHLFGGLLESHRNSGRRFSNSHVKSQTFRPHPRSRCSAGLSVQDRPSPA